MFCPADGPSSKHPVSFVLSVEMFGTIKELQQPLTFLSWATVALQICLIPLFFIDPLGWGQEFYLLSALFSWPENAPVPTEYIITLTSTSDRQPWLYDCWCSVWLNLGWKSGSTFLSGFYMLCSHSRSACCRGLEREQAQHIHWTNSEFIDLGFIQT